MTFSGNKLDRWLHLVHRIMFVRLNDNDDKFIWKLTSSGSFSIKFSYLDLMNSRTVYL
jgi:hypothetical protein